MAINKNKTIVPVLNRIQRPAAGAHTTGVTGALHMPTPRIAAVKAATPKIDHVVTVKFK